ATTAIDPLATRGVEIEPPSAETLRRLKAGGIEAKPARLVDLTLTGTRYDAMKAALDILATAPEFDLVLCVVGSSARFYPELAVRPIIDCAAAAKPIAAYLTPEAPEALMALSRAGVPSFRPPEACADAIAAALRRRIPVATPRPQGGREPTASVAPSESKARLLDELEAYALLARSGIASAPSVVLDAHISTAPALPFPYPVAVKALAAELVHKPEAGGVVLNVGDGDALVAACRHIREKVAATGTRIERALVQPMVSGIGEVLIGYRVDPDVGPLVMVATGGIFTEIYRDRSLRLAPIDIAGAHEMIGELRSLPALAGLRGRPRGDLAALAQAMVALSTFADDPSILEIEVNPLIVLPEGDGVVAVDALARVV